MSDYRILYIVGETSQVQDIETGIIVFEGTEKECLKFVNKKEPKTDKKTQTISVDLITNKQTFYKT